MHVFYHSCPANWETRPLKKKKKNEQNLHESVVVYDILLPSLQLRPPTSLGKCWLSVI